jgi:hypothetical protein
MGVSTPLTSRAPEGLFCLLCIGMLISDSEGKGASSITSFSRRVCTLNNDLSVMRQDVACRGLRPLVGARVVIGHINGGLKSRRYNM